MFGRITCATCLMLTFNTIAWAQPNAPETGNNVGVPATESPVLMEQPLVGDRWTYEIRDEISGKLKRTNTELITEVTPNEISVRIETLGSNGAGIFVYDHAWNMKAGPDWKFTPHDGMGVKAPLKTGSTWKFQGSAQFPTKGFYYERAGSSKVVGEESITTKAGTFNTFKIETSSSSRNANDPTKMNEYTATTWYAPAIDHLVKRTSKVLSDGHVNEITTVELVEYGRR